MFTHDVLAFEINKENYELIKVTELAQLMWQELPIALQNKVCIYPTLCIQGLRELFLVEKNANFSEIIYAITTCYAQYMNKYSMIGNNDLELLIIPLMINDGQPGLTMPNHFTCLYIDLVNKRYYYQDSLGLSINYSDSCSAIHSIMKYFFSSTVSTTVPACVQKHCYTQQLNGNDCGPAVLDNIFAVLKAFALGWPIEVWPGIIAERRLSKNIKNYTDYYELVRQQHISWDRVKKADGLNIHLVAEPAVDLLLMRAAVGEAIKAPKTNLNVVEYYINILCKFNEAVLCPRTLGLTLQAVLNLTRDQEPALQIATEIFMGRVINALWCLNANPGLNKESKEQVIAVMYEKYISNLRRLTFLDCRIS